MNVGDKVEYTNEAQILLQKPSGIFCIKEIEKLALHRYTRTLCHENDCNAEIQTLSTLTNGHFVNVKWLKLHKSSSGLYDGKKQEVFEGDIFEAICKNIGMETTIISVKAVVVFKLGYFMLGFLTLIQKNLY